MADRQSIRVGKDETLDSKYETISAALVGAGFKLVGGPSPVRVRIDKGTGEYKAGLLYVRRDDAQKVTGLEYEAFTFDQGPETKSVRQAFEEVMGPFA